MQTTAAENSKHRVEGVELSAVQNEFLLPHFLLLVVGKPGSGKSHLVKQLVTDATLYRGKFNTVLVVSPSAQKLGIPVKKNYSHSFYSLPWINEQIVKVNTEQVKAFTKELNMSGNYRGTLPSVNASVMQDSIGLSMKNQSMSGLTVNEQQQQQQQLMTLHSNNRFFTMETLSIMERGIGSVGKIEDSMAKGGGGVKRHAKEEQKRLLKEQKMQYGKYKDVDDIEKQLVSKLPPSSQKATLHNMLIILDDVIGDIKANENNPDQAALFFNRRHLIANGTISVMLVSQKYTMIPSRIRSQASWLILFRLNPVDFENVYKDVVMITPPRWESILEYVYDINNEDEGLGGDKKDKTYNHLDIMVEFDIFFKNFQPLTIKK